MDFLIKFAQAHETFRVPEIEALALVEGLDMKIVDYSQDSPFCIVHLDSVESAKRLAKRSILIQSIHELWGKGSTLDELHESVKTNTSHVWDSYLGKSFKFDVDPYQGTRSAKKRIELINSFRFLGWTGPVKMTNPDNLFTIFEMWPYNSVPLNIPDPTTMYLARHVGNSSRELLVKFDLKKRGYISTTSMDSELALVTANLALAAPGKLYYDPFVGTGSFPIACAHFGALAFGSDIDGRSIRGEGGNKSLKGNFDQKPTYVPPKKPYSFLVMLDDILSFAAETLVDEGRLSFWMPTANDEDQEIPVPSHPRMEVVSVCTQPFNKWSRRLITYRRLPDSQVSQEALEAYTNRQKLTLNGTSADELNPFRRGYFNKFEAEE
ncbi:tRNA guanosine-2 O-methyltransferase trm11 [Fusarium tjaetaba]|uniref:tRNA guanosine-2 O-methyltransferase trm11 n=1 Tax=Fusarium tjaetaba TaxID=1567544 RepID=A0A8H5QR13_9HYPO|nr:tRNA guanosine-2 O-methyltransferase trm11 [Fusarium tjaetaba]KAF5618261.1 tRNA guanosine-2 O-methyltransferase trm11 [Fusarium tjaetaba]